MKTLLTTPAAGKALLLWLLAVNLADFLLMAIDKRRARRERWRVPEKWFFLLALLGGAPGAILGMELFRHKTRHWYFRYGLPALLALQLALTAFLFLRRA